MFQEKCLGLQTKKFHFLTLTLRTYEAGSLLVSSAFLSVEGKNKSSLVKVTFLCCNM